MDLKEEIDFKDFSKLDMRVGKVLSVSFIDGSAKLLRLIVDFGDLGERQILSGIKEWYSPEDLVNNNYVFVVNLEPREMFGYRSEGMILAVDSSGKDAPQLLSVNSGVPGDVLH